MRGVRRGCFLLRSDNDKADSFENRRNEAVSQFNNGMEGMILFGPGSID